MKSSKFKVQSSKNRSLYFFKVRIRTAVFFSSFILRTASAAEDIRDIRGPIHIPYPWLWIIYILIGLIALTILAWFYRRWKNRPIEPIKTPHQIALEQLEKALNLMTPEQAREFSIAVSDTVRFYIEKRFNCHAAYQTTEEFLHTLLDSPNASLSRYSTSLEDFLRYCDLAKFAREPLSLPQMQSMHQSAKKFVEETMPIAQPETPMAKSVKQTLPPKPPSLLPKEEKIT